MNREDKLNILESLYLDVEEIVEELQFDYQHSPNYIINPTAFSNLNDTGDWLMICCPNHAEHTASCGVNKEPPYAVNCFFCGFLGTIDEVIEQALDLTEGEGLTLLLSSYMVEEKRAVIDVEAIIDAGRERIKIPSVGEDIVQGYLNSREANSFAYDLARAYMTNERHLTESTLQRYGIGYDAIHNCITFPQRTRTGEARFIQKRKIGSNYRGAKFINDGSPIKKDILFGLSLIDELKYTSKRIRRVRVVEAPIDVLSNYEAGYAAVALNGRLLFDNQVKELQLAGIDTVDLMLDNDEAGAKGTKEATKKFIRAGFHVNFVYYPSPYCKDSNDLLKCNLLHQCPTVIASVEPLF